MKFIFVTGGVMSGLGKGITTASIGLILKNAGLAVTPIKIDPYVNVDAGTMNPYQHGEVWVTEDGGEIDLDLGHYERFLSIDLMRDHNITTGQVYHEVIEKERRGDYLGQTVQIIPHITDEIKNRCIALATRKKSDIVLIEIGGTVGDIESEPFLEAVRQIRIEEGIENTIFVHVTLVPISSTGEQKTKPTQHSVAALRELGIQPDVIVARCKEKLSEEAKRKIALFCNVEESAVISSYDVENIYKVPLVYEDEGLGGFFVRRFFTTTIPRLKQWREIVEKMEKTNKEVDITIAGKYVGGDSYISINEALKHAGAELGAKVNVHWIDTESIEREPSKINEIDNNGVIVPGGFGTRGTEGKIAVIKHLREQKIPYLGLCFGFQLAVVEFARSIGLRDANSTELNQKTMHPVICLLPEQKGLHEKGGTMRLGAQPIKLRKDTKAYEIYNRQEVILERHRHRYEVNPAYIDTFEEHGLIFSGKSPDGKMEIVELKEHPFFIATQFHPEFKSRPGQPSPLFSAFVATAIRQ